MKRMTFDEAFLKLSVAGDERGLAALLKTADRADGKECMECGATDIMDNGATALRYLSLCCAKCGNQWDAVQ